MTRRKVDPDIAWIKLAQAGNADGFKALYEKYFEALYRFCYWQTVDSAVAEDLVQTTFLAVYQQLPKFRFDAQFRNWLYAIAKNTIAAWIRKKRRLPTAPLLDDTPEWLNPETDAHAELVMPQLFSHLSRNERRVLRCRYLRQLNVAQTAKRLKLTESAVKVLAHRAIKKLQAIYPAGL
jgi:RNA polymerase sigma-70 factor (ECF subfamily)